MATNFPASLDTLTNPTSSDSLNSPSHSAQHANVNDAVEALQVKVGIDSSADTSSHDYLIGDLLSRIATLEAAGSPIVKVAAFTSSGTWTVPAGVTYAIAHMVGGGGGTGGSSGVGGTSSVAFPSGTVSATGGGRYNRSVVNDANAGNAGAPNSGDGAQHIESHWYGGYVHGQNGARVVAGDTVTAGDSITVTVGAGGTAGTNSFAGGSGYVWIEYQES
jgi:hypothetical protein